jgi:hypothetical protein
MLWGWYFQGRTIIAGDRILALNGCIFSVFLSVAKMGTFIADHS